MPPLKGEVSAKRAEGFSNADLGRFNLWRLISSNPQNSLRIQTVKKPPESSRGPQPFRPGSARLHLLPLFHKIGSANTWCGHGAILRRKIPFSKEKIVSLQAPRPKNLRFLAETGEGGSGGGACFPVHQLVKTFLTSWARPRSGRALLVLPIHRGQALIGD